MKIYIKTFVYFQQNIFQFFNVNGTKLKNYMRTILIIIINKLLLYILLKIFKNLRYMNY